MITGYIPRQRFAAATDELADTLRRNERDFVDRVRRLFVEKPEKFVTLVIHPAPAIGADESKSPSLEITELMERLLTAAREGDRDGLTIIEHEVFS